MIDFPASPTLGQQFTAAGATWIWDGAKWLPEGLAPTLAPGINDNRIINGDMRIDQRNNGGAGTTNGYTVDRWQYSGSQPSKMAWQRVTTVPVAGFPYALYASTSSAYTPLTNETFCLLQYVEADMVSDFQWGTANAQPVTLSFWAYANQSGVFGGSLRNQVSTRSYPFSFSLPLNGWTKIVITIPGDTAGTWVTSGNASSFNIVFDLGTGATFRAPAGVWAAGNYTGATGTVNTVAFSGGQFILTGVKLEIGSVATPFNRQSLAKSMADCQRYYSVKGQLSMLGYGQAGASIGCSVSLPITMRTVPTIVLVSQTYANASGLAAANISPDGVLLVATVTGTGSTQWSTNFTASAEL